MLPMIEPSNIEISFLSHHFLLFCKRYRALETVKADDTDFDHLKTKIINL